MTVSAHSRALYELRTQMARYVRKAGCPTRTQRDSIPASRATVATLKEAGLLP